MQILLRWLLSALAIIITAKLIPGIQIASFWASLWVALILGLINAVIRPILILITLPINIFTLGLFTFVINGLLVLLASSIIKGFAVQGFWVAVLFSMVLSVISYLLNQFLIK
ncbi:phage holin family protein [Candidatus Parcubacteria bacterium]|nr:phage holin family protein [Patescibacteria group bacterium]MBU4309883.1 phage holin family protein [Patescibacteria group bacterium]MBU4431891.1 phage holin family protein [Patescibacteria group bacterium]MBU4578222.1 phage holin family protein [Patescibacteria group bacterium]MCG2696758.1 phage holin family protein [Candidatus Parcubacteria bacterium]